MIYFTANGEHKEPITPFAFQIQHGWQPLFLSTAHCFARIICQSEVPVVVSNSIDVIIQGIDIQVYLDLISRKTTIDFRTVRL